MMMRGSSFTRLKTAAALLGAGAALSESAAYEIITSTGVADLVVAANKRHCSDALDAAIAIHLKKWEAIALEKRMSLEDVLLENPLVLSFDGAWAHCTFSSVGWGDMIAHVSEQVPGFVTNFPVVGFVVKAKNRKAPGTGLQEAGSSQIEEESFLTDQVSVKRWNTRRGVQTNYAFCPTSVH